MKSAGKNDQDPSMYSSKYQVVRTQVWKGTSCTELECNPGKGSYLSHCVETKNPTDNTRDETDVTGCLTFHLVSVKEQ